MENKLEKYKKPLESILRQKLTSIQYDVTQNSATESPFHNEYWDFFEEGIYVDIVTGEPLFLSIDKFKSSCGWPSFSKPISEDAVSYFRDRSFGMLRIEVRSQVGDSHLGHVFEDGPKEKGGRRFCINSAAIKFIALEDMDSNGYGEYKNLILNIE